jgi:hypothetical protein
MILIPESFIFSSLTSSVQTELLEPLSDEDQKIFDQNSDWIRMMEKFKTICQERELFLYMEGILTISIHHLDDYDICPNTGNAFISTYFWALKHRSNFMSLRLGYNFNGMFMRCDRIGSMIEHIKLKTAKKSPIISIEDEIRNWWSGYTENSPLKQMVFRYNLFKKRDSETGSKCLDGNNAEFVRNFTIFSHTRFTRWIK